MSIRQSYTLAASVALLLAGSVSFAQTADQPLGQSGNTGAVNATWQPSLVKDGVYDRVAHPTVALAWQPIREADIMMKKRVWREIDTREKQNVAFRFAGDEYSGGGYFIEILLDAIKKGKVKAYSSFDDRFTQALTKEALQEIVKGKSDTLYVENPETGQKTMKVTNRDFNPDAITKFRIKEDVIFDRNLGRMVTRIVGLAPYQDIYDPETGNFRASKPMFWLYYPEVRSVLAQYEVYNPENDIARITWDDYFEGRFFSSRIIKVSNPFDASFKEAGATNLEALYQGQHAAEDLFNREHDMWVY